MFSRLPLAAFLAPICAFGASSDPSEFPSFCARNGDVVLIADGTHRISKTISLHSKKDSLIVRSKSGNPRQCVLVGEKAGIRAFDVSGKVRFEGLGFKGFGAEDDGGAVLANPCELGGKTVLPAFVGCAFENCHARNGGAVKGGEFSNCVFRACRATEKGGALADIGRAYDCVFERCEAIVGGAVGGVARNPWGEIRDRVELRGCSFMGNVAPICENENGIDSSVFGAFAVKDCRFEGTRISVYGKHDGTKYVNSITVNPGDDLSAKRDFLRANRKPGGCAEVVLSDGVYTNSVSLDGRDSFVTWRAKNPGRVFFAGNAAFTLGDAKPLADQSLLKRLPECSRGKVRAIRIPEARDWFFANCANGADQLRERFIGPFYFAKRQEREVSRGRRILPQMPVFSVGIRPCSAARWPNEKDCRIAASNVVDGLVRLNDRRESRWNVSDGTSYYHGLVGGSQYRATIGLLKSAGGDGLTAGLSKDSMVHFYHVLEELDAPGEWFYDLKSEMLVFYPPDGAKESDVCALGQHYEHFFRSTGEGVRFEGINFIAKCGYPAVLIERATSNVVRGCTFVSAGFDAVFAGGTGNLIEGCRFFCHDGAAVIVDGGDLRRLVGGGNRVENCLVRTATGGRPSSWGTGAVELRGLDSVVSHCDISECYEAAVYVMGLGNTIEYTRMRRAPTGFSDEGTVYVSGCGGSYGTVFRFNEIIGDVKGLRHGYYPDNCASGSRVYGNVIRNVGLYGIFVGGGRDNVVTNNIVLNCPGGLSNDNRGYFWKSFVGQEERIDEQLIRSYDYVEGPVAKRWPDFPKCRSDKKQMFAPINNIWERNVVIDSPSDCARSLECLGKLVPPELVDRPKNNLYVKWRNKNNPAIWRFGGFSVIEVNDLTELGFTGAQEGDFSLKADAPLLANVPGFVPIPWSDIGLKNRDVK